MMGSKWTKAFILGIGMTLLSSVSAFADVRDDGQAYTMEQVLPTEKNVVDPVPAKDGSVVNPNDSVSYDIPEFRGISEEILKRQQEIDIYLFKEHAEEIRQAGFMVTHTAPTESYVEIGITPYTDENINYLLKVFGKDKVKIVEGMEAIPLMAEDGIAYTTTSVEPDGNVISSNEEPLMDKGRAVRPKYSGIGSDLHDVRCCGRGKGLFREILTRAANRRSNGSRDSFRRKLGCFQ